MKAKQEVRLNNQMHASYTATSPDMVSMTGQLCSSLLCPWDKKPEITCMRHPIRHVTDYEYPAREYSVQHVHTLISISDIHHILVL